MSEGDTCVQVIIPTENAGKMIGKGGEVIRALSEETNTTVRVEFLWHVDSYFE